MPEYISYSSHNINLKDNRQTRNSTNQTTLNIMLKDIKMINQQ